MGAQLDQESLRSLRAKVGSPALAVAAASRAGPTLVLADGVRAVGSGVEVTTADHWHLGSITKSMTATLVARCVDAGHVKWEQTVGEVLRGAVPGIPSGYREANFLHLLSHRAGFPSEFPAAQLGDFAGSSPDPRAERLAWARVALGQKPIGPLGTAYAYSNSGYIIAAAMLETRLRAPWEQLLREQVLVPLGMKSAGYGAPGTPGIGDQPVGHAPGAQGQLIPFPPSGPISDNPAVLGPAGRVHANLADTLRYLAAHRDRTGFLRPETWETLHTPPFGGDYALGWLRRGDSLWHNGSNSLWYAEAAFDLRRGVAAVAVANDGRLDVARSAVNEVLIRALE